MKDTKLSDLLLTSNAVVEDQPLTTKLIQRVVKSAKESVVSIYTKTSTPYRVRLLPIKIPGGGISVELPGAALGSGFVIHSNGYVVTNSHVVANATEIWCQTSEGVRYPMTLLVRDANIDLALLKINNLKNALPPLPMGDSETVGVGEIVAAVGNPLGLGNTVTVGVISQTDLDLSRLSGEKQSAQRFLQTDAAINPGSSGGPLVTLAGVWVGVNTATLRNSEGLGFSIPSSQVRKFLTRVLND